MWNGGMRQGYADKLKVVSALGGAKGLSSLLETAGDMGTGLYPDIDLQYVYKNSLFDSYNTRRDTSRFLIRTTAAVYPYNAATFALDTDAKPRYLILSLIHISWVPFTRYMFNTVMLAVLATAGNVVFCSMAAVSYTHLMVTLWQPRPSLSEPGETVACTGAPGPETS